MKHHVKKRKRNNADPCSEDEAAATRIFAQRVARHKREEEERERVQREQEQEEQRQLGPPGHGQEEAEYYRNLYYPELLVNGEGETCRDSRGRCL